jgi:hypothetical protein
MKTNRFEEFLIERHAEEYRGSKVGFDEYQKHYEKVLKGE